MNARGLKDKVKRKGIFLFCKGQKTHFVFLQETHSTEEDAAFWKMQWGDTILFSHGSSRSAGVAIRLNNCPGKVVTSKSDAHGHWLTAVVNCEGIFVILVNVYGYNSSGQNKILLSNITEALTQIKSKFQTNLVLIGGDFNLVPDEWLDRSPSSYTSHHFNNIIQDFCHLNSLSDIWRVKHPNASQFSWVKPNGSSKSRIDFWLIAEEYSELATNVSISAAPLTDHCLISLTLTPVIKHAIRKDYWKFNAELLKDKVYCSQIRNLVSEIKNDFSLRSSGIKWEYFKFKTREISIRAAKQKSRDLMQREMKLIQEINACCNTQEITQDVEKLLSLQAKLDSMYRMKAQGAFVRSRAKWMEEGEKNTAYFCRLEKRRQQSNAIHSLIINDEVSTDPKLISEEIYSFYSNIYSSSYSENNGKEFLEKVKDFIPQIDIEFKEVCDGDLRVEELDSAIKKMHLGKSPGQDGLTTNFYKFFWEDIKDLLFKALKECFVWKPVPATLRKNIIP